MSTNAATAKHKHRKEKTSAEFKTEAVIEGRVPIKPQDEVDIQGAREVLEMRSHRNLGKAHKVKVIGTDTRLIIKRKSVVGSAPRELSLLCNEIFRFFIFARDPKLVILVVPDKSEGNRAYLLLKMKSESDANRVCNVIQSGRKKLSSQAPLPSQSEVTSPGQSRASKGAISEEPEVEMQENGKDVDKPPTYDVEEESDHSENEEPNTASESTAKESTHAAKPDVSPRAISPRKAPEIESKPEVNKIDTVTTPEVQSAFPAMLNEDKSETEKEDDEENTSPRTLPRTPLHSASPSTKVSKKKQHHRRQPPLIEEMYVEAPKNWKVAQPIYARREEELREALLVDMYDDDWAVDVKIIKTDGGFGSRLSESGNVYMFTAHHLVPENYSYFECSSSSDEEVELKEKPMGRGVNRPANNGVGRRVSSSSESDRRNSYASMSRA
ncbi:hypothetical protein ECG_02067 [Echinococcus granulosus]|uniref:Expressed protein n=1 Tax=Echinococcus granulosus TaxID=6210 RepID=U6JPQ6_ECHGR|nr:hypothetical protein EGR_07941 [Echinococcus granulosus]EUB57192.1 hypothetical protein EGR_07941 [Echinococcus granulosus]KAH9286890.1 hypothetical protein ECG_02067 [Echinococcus granulosus]CDS24544.1 expressed protein [Echinococcus granulosus]